MLRRSCPHCVMPLGRFTVACPRCGRPTPFALRLPRIGAGAVGLALLVALALIVGTRIRQGESEPGRPAPDSAITLAPAPPRGMVAALDSAAAAGASVSRVQVDTASSSASPESNVPDQTGVEVNTYPPDPQALDGAGAGERRRSALEALLRRGLADSVRDRPPSVVQIFVGRAFFRQPARFRDPLMKAFDLAWADPAGNRRTFELWWDTFRVGDYARDTFRFGKWYYEFR